MSLRIVKHLVTEGKDIVSVTSAKGELLGTIQLTDDERAIRVVSKLVTDVEIDRGAARIKAVDGSPIVAVDVLLRAVEQGPIRRILPNPAPGHALEAEVIQATADAFRGRGWEVSLLWSGENASALLHGIEVRRVVRGVEEVRQVLVVIPPDYEVGERGPEWNWTRWRDGRERLGDPS